MFDDNTLTSHLSYTQNVITITSIIIRSYNTCKTQNYIFHRQPQKTTHSYPINLPIHDLIEVNSYKHCGEVQLNEDSFRKTILQTNEYVTKPQRKYQWSVLTERRWIDSWYQISTYIYHQSWKESSPCNWTGCNKTTDHFDNLCCTDLTIDKIR